MTKQRSQFGCGYLQTTQEVKHVNIIIFVTFVQQGLCTSR